MIEHNQREVRRAIRMLERELQRTCNAEERRALAEQLRELRAQLVTTSTTEE